MVSVLFKKNHPDAKVPFAAYEQPACFDLHSVEDVVLNPGETKLVDTGLSVALPEGYEMQIRPRSGLAAKHGVMVLNSPGTVDADYRGPVKVILHNASSYTYSINKGDRIAQCAIRPVPKVEWIEVTELPESARGDKGFGSSGK